MTAAHKFPSVTVSFNLITSASLLVSFVALELACRLFAPQPLFRLRFSPTLLWEQEPGAEYLYVKDEFRSLVRYSSAGLRDSEHPLRKPAGTFRIALLGDSFTEALQVPLEQGYPKQLEAALNRTSDTLRYEVINRNVSIEMRHPLREFTVPPRRSAESCSAC